ncbi:MAG TPA: tRNA epoxyqueuosine(34) reductase QueG [Acidimicrobiales bacterium]|nr:tRNA epoxyqueuosine(34) reductase QueG [Acidimicrobiales bacterium]
MLGATELRDRVAAAGRDHGLDEVGCTDVASFPEVRRSLDQRKAAGQHAGMSFTFRNPRRSTEPDRLLRNARTLVVGAKSYLESRPERPVGPVAAVARYAWRDHYAELRAGLEAMAEVLRDHGHRAAVFADDNALVDRAAAHRAGIGWWGRNSNLLIPGAGSWFVLGSVVTDAALPVASAPVADGCRSCTRCVDACPTGAITADGVIDARRCLAWLVQDVGVFPREHRVALGDRIYGCDDCQEVCPPGRRDVAAVDRSDVAVHLGSPPDAWVSVLELLDPDVADDELLERFGRWYIPRRDPRHLRRNALVVLGNVGDASDPRQRAAVTRWCRDGDELLRAHAVWAAARLGLCDLVDERRDDPSPLVRSEVAMAPSVPRAPGALA